MCKIVHEAQYLNQQEKWTGKRFLFHGAQKKLKMMRRERKLQEDHQEMQEIMGMHCNDNTKALLHLQHLLTLSIRVAIA